MKKLMIVDDAQFMRMSIKQMLQDVPVEIVAEAGDGFEAVAQFKSKQPDIITLDVTMPNMSGIETLEAIRKMNKDVKIIMVTAMGNKQVVAEAVMLGATSFIVKPFEKNKLIEVIESVI